ncbi:hypothetical protein OPQ81_005999 [Rhizoctonia solani]|nr:hypothetical protein OPQ81_005999 [Rhizoctonia solani]
MYSSYESAPNHGVTQQPDSANRIPHQGVPQYGGVVPGQSWADPDQYSEVITTQPGDLYDQRRGSCASMSTNTSDWCSHDGTNGEHHSYTQSPVVGQSHSNHYQQQQQQFETMNFGMYSPTQYARTQELAHNAHYDTDQWVPTTGPECNFEAPYGTLPVDEPCVKYERRPSNAYQPLESRPVSHQSTHASPSTRPRTASAESPSLPSSPPENSLTGGRSRDLFIQQRQAASYQQELQAQQELKYQLSGDFQQFEATHRRQNSFTPSQDNNYMAPHEAPHQQNHPGHQRHDSSSSDHYSHRLAPAPIVPSQARERVLPYPHASPEVEEKKESPPKKPALACLFCRKRKIACGPPPPDNPDRTCNQCLRRKQHCEYPTESRRGIRKAPKEPAPEEPTVHKFVHGDATSHEGTGAIRSRGRRKRTTD